VADRPLARPGSLRRSILVWLVLATAAIGVIALVDTRIEALRTARDVSDRVLVGSAMSIAEGVDADAQGGVTISVPFSALDMLSSTAQDQVFYRVDGPQGLLTGYEDLATVPVSASVSTGLADLDYRGARVRTATILREITTGEGTLPIRVTVAETTRARDALASAILTRSALRIALLIVGAALVAWAATTYALRPLDRLSRQIAARAPHDLTRIADDAPAELLPVLDALNGFLSRLSAAMAALQNFASTVNHQIRTPLTVARAQVGLAGRPDRGDQRGALDKADAALIRIERVLEQVLLLAQIEATGTRPDRKSVDVALLARYVTADLLPQAVRLGKDLGYEGPDNQTAWSEEVLLGELLRNLVDNALTHCPAGALVTVHLQEACPGSVRLSVTDTGFPLSDQDLARFHDRLDTGIGATGFRAGRHGLGLPIVAEISRALGASLSVGRGPGGLGLDVSVILPIAPAD
jgi:two-component system sensor histidine kinase TctE